MIRWLLAALLLCAACREHQPGAPIDAAAGRARAPAPPANAAARPQVTADGGAGADGGRAGSALPPSADQVVGVEACDEYLDKMSRCVAKLEPEAQQPMRNAIVLSRAQWRATASTPAGKKKLATACQQALDAGKSAAAAMGCEW